MSEINGHEYQLLKIFSSDFEYHIPAYQRPYAWTTEETNKCAKKQHHIFTHILYHTIMYFLCKLIKKRQQEIYLTDLYLRHAAFPRAQAM